MIKSYKVLGILVNTLVTCGLTLALILNNTDKRPHNMSEGEAVFLGSFIGFVGNAFLIAINIDNSLED